MNIKTFIEFIVNFDNVGDILKTYKTQSEKGFIFERLYDIIIKFGFCNLFPNSEYEHLIGNVNTGLLKKLDNLHAYIENNVISGNSGGCSDITLKSKDSTYIFISSKYPKSDDDLKKQRSIKYYDVQNIVAMVAHNETYKNYTIFLVVPNKLKILNKVKKANKSSQYITKFMTERNILDENDLNQYFRAFKSDVIQNMHKLNEIYLSPKMKLNLRFHQELITNKTNDLIKKGNKSFLWGCKCRSGKTYMIGGIIIKMFNERKKLNALIITPAPSETLPQFTDGLFNKFRDFNMFKIHQIESFKNIKLLELGENNIFIVSKQLMQKYINGKAFKDIKIDLIAFDENHFSGTTDLSKKIITAYCGDIVIYMTATFLKPLREWNISPECQMFWDLEDEQMCKIGNISYLYEKHGKDYVEPLVDKVASYSGMPNLHLITNLFDQQRYDDLKKKLNAEHKMGFCFETLFSLNLTKTKFAFEEEVIVYLRYISGSHKEQDGEKTIFPRIKRICSESGTRYPFTQIWFLPSDNIDEISACLTNLILRDNILKRYEILNINRKNLNLARDVKINIEKSESKAQILGKSGVILLAGNMLSLGITLNLCDLVILMNDSLSFDKIYQQMFRCMTEAKDKSIGFVVDLNISRVLNTCVNYITHKNNHTIDEKLTHIIKYRLINIDVDMLVNTDVVVEKLLDVWQKDPINSLQILMKKLTYDQETYDTPTQNLINSIFTKCDSIKHAEVEITLTPKFLPDDNSLPDGKELPDGKHSLPSGKEFKNDDTISFTRDVLPYVIPLTCILTLRESNKDFSKMLEIIGNDPSLLDIFDEQCQIWWKKNGILSLIKDIVEKNFGKSSNAYNIAVQFKTTLHSLIDKPRELLELIAECLKPKNIEKKEFGEVFTPMPIINEMLDKLPAEIWKNKNLRWFDPAVGMGNFPVAVYLRLFESLRSEIADDNSRKKHILEKMLYMCELNKKNVAVCKQIFNMNNEFALNLHQGDTLEYNSPIKFDIIMGNPPYNKGGIKSHTKKLLGDKNETIWPKFVNKMMQWLNPDGFLVFITPLSWLKNSHSNHEILLNRHIMWMKLWDNIKSLSTIHGKIPISIFVMKNVNNAEKLNTMVISEIQSKKIITESNLYLDAKYSIPIAYHSIFNKLLTFIIRNNLKLEYSKKTTKSTGLKFKLPEKYIDSDLLSVDTFTIKEGIMVKKTLEKHPDANKRKLIIANKCSFNGIFIDDGRLSLTGNHKFYITGDNLESLVKMFKFKFVDIVCHYTKYSQDFLDESAFLYLPDMRKLGDITEEQLYAQIGFTPEDLVVFKHL